MKHLFERVVKSNTVIKGAMGGLALILAGIITAAIAPVVVWLVLRFPALV